MKVAFVHTSLKLYWLPRLTALQKHFEMHGLELIVIELVGTSLVYSFDEESGKKFSWWNCLFPGKTVQEVPVKEISRAAYAMLTNENPDVVICGAIAFPCGAVSIRWANRFAKKVILFDDVKVKNVRRNALVNGVKQLLYNRVDAYFAPSASYCTDLSFWHFRPDVIYPGLNCVDNRFFRKKTAGELATYPFKGIQYHNGVNYLLCVARLVPIKNHSGLLRAWKTACAKSRSLQTWRLVLVGDGPLKRSLQQQIAAEQIPGVVSIDFLPQSALPFYYSASAALILPSFAETWGLVVNEAMAAGLPVLLSNQCNCCEDLVYEGQNGFVFDPANIQSIANAILKLIHHPGRQQMGAASEKIIAAYSLSTFCENLTRAVHDVARMPVKKSGYLATLCINTWKGRFTLAGFNGT